MLLSILLAVALAVVTGLHGLAGLIAPSRLARSVASWIAYRDASGSVAQFRRAQAGLVLPSLDTRLLCDPHGDGVGPDAQRAQRVGLVTGQCHGCELKHLMSGERSLAETAMSWVGGSGYAEYSMLLALLMWAAWERRLDMDKIEPKRVGYKLGEDALRYGCFFGLMQKVAADEGAVTKAITLLQHATPEWLPVSPDRLPRHLAWGRVLAGLGERSGELPCSPVDVRAGDVVVPTLARRPSSYLVPHSTETAVHALSGNEWDRTRKWSLKTWVVVNRSWLREQVRVELQRRLL